MFLTMVLVLAPLGLLICTLMVWKWWWDKDDRRNPLSMKVLKGAGDGLRAEIARQADSFDEALLAAFSIGPWSYILWSNLWMTKAGFSWSRYQASWFDFMLLVGAVLTTGECVRRLVRASTVARRHRQGLAAELATAQCLNQVMSEGGYLFHDFPGDGFNIDHIVIGQSAVFAIETKSRLKPARTGKEAARVAYDGARLMFPDHFETKPLAQAKRQADWLAKFLASGTGEPVRVIPYLALPGWFVDNKVQRPEVLVGNPKNPMFMVRAGFGPPLSEAMKRRVAHVLSERYPEYAD